MSARKPLIAGNWKMYGREAELKEISTLNALAASVAERIDVVICPPATLIARASKTATFGLGGQDCHASAEGAHTGDISAPMLADAGAGWVIVGHSERRRDHAETDASVRAKASAAHQTGLVPIICVGETVEERKAGKALEIVGGQLQGSLPDKANPLFVVAYEPVWAIGTGLTPTNAEIAEMHGFIRDALTKRYGAAGEPIRVLYGGSVKPSNAGDIFATPGVDGALVGGASLKAADFGAIIQAHPAVTRAGN